MNQGVTVEIGGKQRTLRLDDSAIFRLDMEYKPLNEVVDDLERGSYAAFVHLIWAARLHAERRLKVDTVVNELPRSSMNDFTKPIVELLLSTVPEDRRKEIQEAADVAVDGEESEEGNAQGDDTNT